MGNKVAVCLCSFDYVVMMVLVYLELCTCGCEVRVHSNDRRMDDLRPREPVQIILVAMNET